MDIDVDVENQEPLVYLIGTIARFCEDSKHLKL